MNLPDPTEVLPHREPFLWIDRCVELGEDRVVCERTFRADEPFFAGHFPGHPVVPGVLLLEGLAQTLAYFALRSSPGAVVMLTGVDRCRFRRPVRPGETVRFEAVVERALLGVVTARATATVAGALAASATIKGYMPGAGETADPHG